MIFLHHFFLLRSNSFIPLSFFLDLISSLNFISSISISFLCLAFPFNLFFQLLSLIIFCTFLSHLSLILLCFRHFFFKLIFPSILAYQPVISSHFLFIFISLPFALILIYHLVSPNDFLFSFVNFSLLCVSLISQIFVIFTHVL